MVELLKQPQNAPFPVERQVVSLWAGTTGKLDDVPVADIRRFETEFLDYIGREHPGIYGAILSTGKLEGDTIAALEFAITELKKQFTLSDGKLLVNEAVPEALDPAAVAQESITVHHHRPKPQPVEYQG
jgi:F-type H+-transporting ATPase subunit alpha